MTGKTVTRADLAMIVHRTVGVSKHESGALVRAVIEEISSALARGEAVKLPMFGTFVVQKRKLRFGRNPKTGTIAPILARQVPRFRPSEALRTLLNDD